MSLKTKLNRLKPHLGINENKAEPTSQKQGAIAEIPYLEEWKKAQVTPYYFDNDYCLIREVTYPLTHHHGKYQFKDLFTAVRAWNESKLKHPLSAAGHMPDDLFFFDTETTGLGGGVGNTIFLLGHARVTESFVTVKQHILPHPGAEIPLYQSFLESINYKTLVTYNGRAFDWPQVKTRHTLIREHVPKLPAFGHFDLYHAARRMWKHRLDRLKLSMVEEEILEVGRKDDIPGFLAPMIYFDFLERKQPDGLLGVIRHNEQDILSLIVLYIHLSFQLLQMDENQSANETFEVGRWFSAVGDTTHAKKVFDDLLHKKDQNSAKVMHALAMEHKRGKEWGRAVHLWQRVAEIGPLPLKMEACIELAKVFEHRIKKLELAIKYSEMAKSFALADASQNNVQLLEKINKRLERLRKKRARIRNDR
jgi:uncharacterized protein YprB with RNaseH-like and TPR domain